jgi:hypothetical protein
VVYASYPSSSLSPSEVNAFVCVSFLLWLRITPILPPSPSPSPTPWRCLSRQWHHDDIARFPCSPSSSLLPACLTRSTLLELGF